MNKLETTSVCPQCLQSFTYLRTSRPRMYCSGNCRYESVNERDRRRREENRVRYEEAARLDTLNPRPSLQRCSSVASCAGVLVPPSEIPANDIGYVLEPPLPKQSWFFEVGGVTLNRLSEAEEEAKNTGFPIYCRPKDAAQKAAS